MKDLKELEEYIIKNVREKNFYNVINGLIVYVDNDPAAPENIKLLNRTLKHVFWLAVMKQNLELNKNRK